MSELVPTMSELTQAQGPSDLLPEIPLRPEDADLISRWLADREGTTQEPINELALYRTEGGHTMPTKDWCHDTIVIAKRKAVEFARRMPVPLTRVGLLPGGGFTPDSLRAPIIAFAKDFELRNRDRVAALLVKMGREANRLKGPLVWRTKSWWYHVHYTREFYNWLERRGLRPRNSNPWVGVHNPMPARISRTQIVEEWFTKILGAYYQSPKEAAIIQLLGNGLRRDEIIKLRVEDYYPTMGPSGVVHVLGKGSKLRDIPLYRRTRLALDRWLDFRHRRNEQRPWMFPATKMRRAIEPYMDSRGFNRLVERVALRILRDPTIAARVTPHKFRHFFVSDWLYRSGGAAQIKALVGHASFNTLQMYQHTDPVWVAAEVLRMDPDISQEEKRRALLDPNTHRMPSGGLEPPAQGGLGRDSVEDDDLGFPRAVGDL